MPEPTQDGQPQGDPVAPPIPPTEPTPPPGDPKNGDSPDKLKAALDSERSLRAQAERDAKAKAKELTDAQARLKELDDAQKSDAEKALARAEAAEKTAADLQTKLRTQSVRHAVASAARDQSFHDVDDAYRFLDLDTVEFDDDGNPKGIAELVKQLAKDKPHLIKPASNSGPPATPRSDRQNGDMTPDEKRAHDLAFATHVRSRF